jgi:MtN3 and saliva related transmembrane protein
VEATDIFGPIASFMGVLMSLAPMFQVRRVLHRRQADDVSLAFLIVIALGATAWCAYGISTGDPYLIIPNSLGVVTNVLTLVIVRRYQRAGHLDPGRVEV